MDFVADTLAHGRTYGVLTIIDDTRANAWPLKRTRACRNCASSVCWNGFLKRETYQMRFTWSNVLSSPSFGRLLV